MKKHCKQALSALLTIAMVLSLLIVPTGAAGLRAAALSPVTVDKTDVTVQVDDTVDVTYEVNPDTSVYALSDDASVTVTVGEDKVSITGVSEGTATVYVVASDAEVTELTDAVKTAATKIKVTVKAATPVDVVYTITADAEAAVKVGETVQVAVAADKGGVVYANTEDTGIIELGKIADGKLPITGKAAGDATVTLGVTDGKGSKEIMVTVTEPVTGPVTEWNFGAADFTDDKYAVNTPADYNGLKFSQDGKASKQADQGDSKKPHVMLKKDGTITVPVSGPCGISVTTYYSNGGTATVGTDELACSGNDTVTDNFFYTGTDKTVTITGTNGTVYIKSIKLFDSVWTFPQADIAAAVSKNEYKGLKLTKVTAESAAGKDHAVLGNGSKIEIPVPGKCDVNVTCYYGGAGTVGDEPLVSANNGTGATATYHYNGAAGYVEINATGTSYVKKIELTAYTDPSPKIELSAETANLELGGKAVEITASYKNVGDAPVVSELTATVPEADKDIVTAEADKATGKITLKPGTKVGKTTVTVSAKLDGVAEALTAEIAVELIDPNATPTDWNFLKGVNDQTTRGLKTSGKFSYHGATYGVDMGTNGVVSVPVDGPAKITVTGGYHWEFGLGDALDVARYGAASGDEWVDKETNEKHATDDEVFIYTGGKGYVNISAIGKASSYIAAIKVDYEGYKDFTPNSVVVWDFGAEALDTSLFVNKLNVENIVAQYPAGTEAKEGVAIPKEGFNFYEGALKFNTNEKTNNRLRTMNTALPRHDSKSLLGAQGADPYAPSVVTKDANGKVTGGVTYTGYVYSNSSSTDKVNLTMKLNAGDKVTFLSGSNGGVQTYELKAPSGAIESGEYTLAAKAEPLTFFAKETGEYTYYGINEKMVVARIYQEPGVKATVSGTVDATKAPGIPTGYALVFTGPGGIETTAVVGSDGKYTAELNNYLSGAEYTVSLKDADGFVVATGEEFALDMADRTATHDVVVAAVDLVTVSGKVAGLSEADLANLVLTVNKVNPDLIYTPKIVPAADGSYTASFEKGAAYTLTAANVNDYDLVKTDLTYSADTTANIVFTAKPTYAITMATDPAGVDLSKATITFINPDDVDDKHPDGYTYTFTGPEGIKLRDGQYVVKVEGASGIQELTPDLVVNGSDTTCTVPFNTETPTKWDFSDPTWNPDVAATNAYNGLVLSGVSHNKTFALTDKKGGSTIQIPVTKAGDIVTVTYCYSGTGTLGDVAFAASTCVGSTSKTESVSYTVKDADVTAGFVTLTGAAEKGATDTKGPAIYVTKIEVTQTIPYAATVTVGADKTYKTINEALAAVKAMVRTAEQRVTIEIDPGDYQEMLRIDTPNVTLKNASATPSIELKNKGVDIDANAVRITSYYGHGYAYYSMDKDCSYNAELLEVNKQNGKLSFENPGTGTTSGSYWNATVQIMASGVEAEGIIFENSFNQYQSELAANDVIIPLAGAKEGSVPRSEMQAGDTTVQHKEYVERAAALAIRNNCDKIYFENCKFVGRQDTLYGGEGSKVGFKDCVVMGGTDYIFGGMNAVFAQCELMFNTNDETAKGQKDDVGYITAPQQKSGRGYLMYNCLVTSTTPGVDTASTSVSKPGTFGRPWQANTSEAVFYKTYVEATDPAYYGDGVTTTSMIQPAGWLNTLSGESELCGDFETVDYYIGATTAPADRAKWSAKFTKAETADGKQAFDYKTWMGEWNPFGTLTDKVWFTPKAFDVATLKDELKAEIEKGTSLYNVVDDTDVYTVSDDATTVPRGDKLISQKAKDTMAKALDDAKDVYNNASDTVAEVLAAVKAMAKANTAFINAVKTGTKAPTTADLEAAIAAAEAKMAGVVTSEGPADKVVKDVKFASKAEMDAIKAALAAAKTAKDSKTNTQADVDAATKALTDATAAFVPKTGTKSADPASLKAAIEAAKAAKEGVVVNAGPADQVDTGVKFVPAQSVIDALNTAITAAETVANNANATQAQLDEALKDLTIATTDFEASIQTGAKVDKAALQTAVDTATEAMKGVEGNDAASEADVDKGTKYVPTAIKTALETAIAGANTVLADASATEEQVTAAKTALDEALTAFNAAIKTGTKEEAPGPDKVDKTALTEALTAAKGVYAIGDDVEVMPAGTEPSDVANGDKFVTQDVYDALADAIAKAEAVNADENATAEDVKNALDALNAAKDAFKVQTGTKSSGSRPSYGGGGGGGTTPSNKNVFDDTVKATSNRNGKTVTVTRDGKVIAKVEIPKTIPAVDFKFTDLPDDHWAAEDIYKIAGLGLIQGVSGDDHVYDLDAPLTRGSLAAILYRLAQGNATGLKTSFADVAEDAWYADAIAWAAEYGIVKGYSESAFGPDDPITREQLATMLYRFAQLLNLDMSKTTALSSFVDGSQVSDWATNAMSWDVGTGIIKGAGANNLVPLASATRAQTATMLARFIGLV